MKILLSAYACEPNKGSEPEVGLRVLLAAASRHDVWVLTRANNIAALEKYLANHPLRERIHLEGFDIPGLAFRAKKLGLPGLHWYYDVWQRRARQRARDLDAIVNFDVFHHATFATYWTRPGVGDLGKPFVWGPVGGGVGMPLRLLPTLGVRGLTEDVLRYGARAILGRSPWVVATARSAAVVLVQNREAAEALPNTDARVSIVPNATSVRVDPTALERAAKRNMDVLLVGRLVAWKGAGLAIRAMGQLSHDAILRVYGAGPDTARLHRLAGRMGLEDKVVFMGRTARDELLKAIAQAGCVVHPALHDDSPLGVAEVLSLGTPLVCLDHGGPVELLRHWPDSPSRALPPGSVSSTVALIAQVIDECLDQPPPIPDHPLQPTLVFDDEILNAYELAVRPTTS
jgi:glycosyltransferase involved in cell wall biosynthesis